jgi:hypothetical protein
VILTKLSFLLLLWLSLGALGIHKRFVSFEFLNLWQSVGILWWGISPSQGRYLTHTSMPWVGFEPTIPAFKRAKTFHDLDRAATVIGRKLSTPHILSTQNRHGESCSTEQGRGVANCRPSDGTVKFLCEVTSIKLGIIAGQFSPIIYNHTPTTFIFITDNGDQCSAYPTLPAREDQRSSETNTRTC